MKSIPLIATLLFTFIIVHYKSAEAQSFNERWSGLIGDRCTQTKHERFQEFDFGRPIGRKSTRDKYTISFDHTGIQGYT